VLAVLRLLLMGVQEEEERGRTEYCRVGHGIHNTAHFIRERLGLTWVSDTDVQHCFRVLKSHCVGVSWGVLAVYPLASILSDSPVPNLELQGDSWDKVVFTATRNIYRGEELSLRYITFPQPGEQLHDTRTCSCSRWEQIAQLCHFGGFNIKKEEMEGEEEGTILTDQLNDVTSISDLLDKEEIIGKVENWILSQTEYEPDLKITFLEKFEDDCDAAKILLLAERAGSILDIQEVLETSSAEPIYKANVNFATLQLYKSLWSSDLKSVFENMEHGPNKTKKVS